MSNESEVLKITVHEDVKLTDVPPGGQEKKIAPGEKLPPEEMEKRQKIILEFTRLMGRYCPHTNKKARWVTKEDLPRVLADGKDLVSMCNLPRGKYGSVATLSHIQIDDKDPLRFFVMSNGLVVINPMVLSSTKFPITKSEGCMSHADMDLKYDVQRYNKITALYQTLEKTNGEGEPVISNKIQEEFNGGKAHIFQHNTSHLNGSCIYDTDYSPEKCMFLGDGALTEEEINNLYKQ